VAVYTGEPILAGLAGMAVLVTVNALWWKFYRGERLSDVYPALSPWVRK
jgi:hypothetical protein